MSSNNRKSLGSLPRLMSSSKTEKRKTTLSSSKSIIRIHPPPLLPDCPVQHFEHNLDECIDTLEAHHQVMERNKDLEIELSAARQLTMNMLIQKLGQRKQDQEVVKKCVGVLVKIKDEYQLVKKRIAEDAVARAKDSVVLRDQGTQCEEFGNKSTVGTTTCDLPGEALAVAVSRGSSPVVFISDQEVFREPDGDSYGIRETVSQEDIIRASMESQHEDDEMQGKLSNSIPSSSPLTEAVTFDVLGTPVSTEKTMRKMVTFNTQSDFASLAAPAAASYQQVQQKRVPLQTSSINMFKQIIPTTLLENPAQLPPVASSPSKVLTSTAISDSAGRSLISRAKSFSNKISKTSGAGHNKKLPSKQDLLKIYQVARCKKPSSQEIPGTALFVPGDLKEPEGLLPLVTPPLPSYNNTSLAAVMAQSSRSLTKIGKRMNSVAKLRMDEYTPFTPPRIVRKNNTATDKSGIDQDSSHMGAFRPSITRPPKQKRSKWTPPVKRRNDQGSIRESQLAEFSNNGKRMVQTLLHYEPEAPEDLHIDEFSSGGSGQTNHKSMDSSTAPAPHSM